MRTLTLITLGLAAVSCGLARAELEIVENGGFESGVLYPWTAQELRLNYGGGGHSGNYCAWMASDQYTVEGWIKENLDRTYFPSEVRNASFWVYPDLYSTRNGGRTPCYTYAYIALGDNTYGTGDFYGLGETWQEVEMPLNYVTTPFNYVYVNVNITVTGAPPPYNLYGAVDDISVMITGTSVSPTSLGRVKALYR